MSIANEIVRLKNAKADMKTALEKRGALVAKDTALDVYSEILESVPYTIHGTFTPEEDTDTFEMNALSFKPQVLVLTCLDLENVVVPSSIALVVGRENNPGGVYYYSPASEKRFAFIKSNSDVITWNENSVKVKVISANSGYFKKDYTYRYVLTGGFNQ